VLDNLLLSDSGAYDVVVTTGGTTLTSPVISSRWSPRRRCSPRVPAPGGSRFINGTVRFVSTVRGKPAADHPVEAGARPRFPAPPAPNWC